MKCIIAFSLTLILFQASTLAQEKYGISKERIESKSVELIKLQGNGVYYPAGRNQNILVYQVNQKSTNPQGRKSSEAVLKVYYDEVNRKLVDSIPLPKNLQKIRKLNQVDNVTLFHGFYSVPPEYEKKLLDELDRGEFLLDYQDIWVAKNTQEIKLKTYPEHYLDKDVEYSIDNSGKYVLISTFVSTYMRSTKADSIINVFKIDNGSNRQISCVECIKPQVIGNYIYYGKKFYYLRGADVYDWKIYRAPVFDLAKSEVLGEYIELLSVSSDGKYILGKKILYGKETLVILNTATKKFQYLLGRDYAMLKLFYSPGFRQFAFDREADIVYIEYPKNLPFNSIGQDVKPVRSTSKDDKLFWDRFPNTPK